MYIRYANVKQRPAAQLQVGSHPTWVTTGQGHAEKGSFADFYSLLGKMLMTTSSCYPSWQAVRAAWSKETRQAAHLASNLFPPALLVVTRGGFKSTNRGLLAALRSAQGVDGCMPARPMTVRSPNKVRLLQPQEKWQARPPTQVVKASCKSEESARHPTGT